MGWSSWGNGCTSAEQEDQPKSWTYVDAKKHETNDETPRKEEREPHPEACTNKPRNLPDTPVPYVGPPSPNCAPAAAQVSDRQFAQIA